MSTPQLTHSSFHSSIDTVLRGNGMPRSPVVLSCSCVLWKSAVSFHALSLHVVSQQWQPSHFSNSSLMHLYHCVCTFCVCTFCVLYQIVFVLPTPYQLSTLHDTHSDSYKPTKTHWTNKQSTETSSCTISSTNSLKEACYPQFLLHYCHYYYNSGSQRYIKCLVAPPGNRTGLQ